MIASTIARGVLIGTKIVSSIFTITKTSMNKEQIQKIKGKQLGDLFCDEVQENPNFQIVVTHNGKIIKTEVGNIGVQKFIPEILLEEAILSVDRHCSSKWKHVPSGIATVFTWTFTGMACRHEYFIIETENFIIKIEVPKSDGQKIDGKQFDQPVIKIQILDAFNPQQRKQNKKEFENQESFDRSMKKLEKHEILPNMKFKHIVNMIFFWRIFHLEKNNDILGLESKSLCRTLFYYSKFQSDLDWIMYSIMGCFTDKPMEVFIRFDQILIEKTMLKIFREVKEEQYKQCIQLIDLLRKISYINDEELQQLLQQTNNQEMTMF